MATPFESTPTWFNAEYYIGVKLAQLLADDPNGGWTRETMLKAFADNGFENAYDHYLAYGDKEGLSPNALFNNTEYLAAKAAQMGSTWTAEMVAKAIQDAGMTLMEHYERYGSQEGISPSSAFNQDKYFDAKLDQLQLAEPDKGWTMETMKEAFAKAGLTPLDHFLLFSKDEGLDKFDYSENGAPIPHPGNTSIVLTTGVDIATPDSTEASLKTSDRDDVISAVVSSVSSKGTLNAGDVIDGGKGVDTLKVDMQGSFGGFTKGGSVKNVEKIVLENAGGSTFDAKGVEGAERYTLNIGAKTSTIKNVDTVATQVSLTADKGATFNLQFADAAVAGKEDNATVTLSGVGEASGSVNLKVGATTSGKVETLTLQSTGKGNFVNVQSAHDALVVTGESDLDVLDAIAGLKSFDASAALGDVKADIKSSSDTLKTIKGGLGDDTITLSKLASGAVLDGGEGSDNLVIKGHVTGLNIKQAITGFETITFVDAATGGVVASTLDLTNVDGLTTIKYEGAATADDTIDVKGTTLSALNFLVKDEVAVSTGTFTYAGAGSLTVGLYGNAAAGASAAFGDIIAKNITELTITNTAENKAFTLADIQAKSLETLTIDTGKNGGVIVGDGANGDMGALKSITFTGSADGTFDAFSEKSLETVDATELTGKLTLDLSELTHKVEIYTGSDSEITSSQKGDVINLGSGEDVLKYTAYNQSYQQIAGSVVTNEVDVVYGFDVAKDKIAVAAAAFKNSTTGTASDSDIAVCKFEFDAGGAIPSSGSTLFGGNNDATTFAYGHYNGNTYLYVNTNNYDLKVYENTGDMVIKFVGEIDFTAANFDIFA